MSAQTFFRKRSASPKRAVKSFILLGGFLGAGKTTCLVALAKWLRDRGLKCGIITNDQAAGLVDTASVEEALAAAREPKRSGDRRGGKHLDNVRQITGGCFCCRADELMTALRELQWKARPDVFLAEPVGSCTDLVATVLLPLEQVYRAGFRRAPMSVVLDAKRAWEQCFGWARGGGFSKDVRYIYLKQMEEAEILVVNKSDLLTSAQQSRLRARLERDWPGKRVLLVSARSGEGMEEWFRLLLAEESQPERVMEVDYRQYGKGEALMGWYNARLTLEMPGCRGVDLRSTKGKRKSGGPEVHATMATVDGNIFLLELAQAVQADLEKAGVEIAHFKMSLQGETGLAVVNAVRNGSPAELSRSMKGQVAAGELLINLRAEGAPTKLERIVARHLKGLPVRWEGKAAFRPGQPKPVHRVSAV